MEQLIYLPISSLYKDLILIYPGAELGDNH